ncbi:aspartic proteinase CDR1-like [Cornus florida]|uniref:aspartic proteinase CDR1-like n=1 Tax=Cornus florida TaxID=4283 RepID=UPI00289C9B3C|nr:aspartic proteinase CDR1-like [Cornus florida]
MAASFFNLSALFYSTFIVSCIINLSVNVEASNGGGGFTVDLIHRDSPLSPFYNPSNTHSDRLRNAFHRSTLRAAHFKPTSTSTPGDSIQSQMIPSAGEYLMRLSIGTPPVSILGIADTGSDLTWAQCEPCISCYKQKAPIFNSTHSSTYEAFPCDSKTCQSFSKPSCSHNVCQYSLSYADGSLSTGDYAVETFTFGSTSGHPVSVPKVIFGCGHDNEGNFNESYSGIIGLGWGKLSLVSQLGEDINGKFSYCLVPFNSSSSVTGKINFGSNAIVSGSGVVSTPLVSKAPETYYYLTLEGITAGNKTLPYKSWSKSKAGVHEGNIIIDSGTTLTLLPRDFYDRLESALVAAIRAKRAQDPQGIFSLCYATQGRDFDVPTVTFHFAGADLDLPASSTFVSSTSVSFVNGQDDLVCLTIIPTDDVAIFGNLAQTNYLVGYDLVNKKLSFKPTDCTKV